MYLSTECFIKSSKHMKPVKNKSETVQSFFSFFLNAPVWVIRLTKRPVVSHATWPAVGFENNVIRFYNATTIFSSTKFSSKTIESNLFSAKSVSCILDNRLFATLIACSDWSIPIHFRPSS